MGSHHQRVNFHPKPTSQQAHQQATMNIAQRKAQRADFAAAIEKMVASIEQLKGNIAANRGAIQMLDEIVSEAEAETPEVPHTETVDTIETLEPIPEAITNGTTAWVGTCPSCGDGRFRTDLSGRKYCLPCYGKTKRKFYFETPENTQAPAPEVVLDGPPYFQATEDSPAVPHVPPQE